MQTDELVKKSTNSFNSEFQILETNEIDRYNPLTVDSIWHLKNTYPDLSSIISIEGTIKRVLKTKYIGFGNK